VVHVREASPGDTLGYGATHVARGNERWATVAVGYGDGLPRALGNRGRALLRGHPVPLVGRVSMDMTVLDVTHLPGPVPERGEVATLLGRDGEASIELDEVAAQAGTISYEVLTGFTPRLPRLWLDEGEGA
jgi:alanine racemase